MNHTKNYGLPQWELNDLIRMEDFNSMNASIENGLTTTAATAESAAATAEKARQFAVAANQTAGNAFSLGNMPYAVGKYTGTAEDLPVEIGFRPSFVIAAWNQYTNGTAACHIVVTDSELVSQKIAFTDNGFLVKSSAGGYTANPQLNVAGMHYVFIAFR